MKFIRNWLAGLWGAFAACGLEQQQTEIIGRERARLMEHAKLFRTVALALLALVAWFALIALMVLGAYFGA